MKRSRRTKAYSLVEVLIVGVIIAILLAVGLPNYLHPKQRARTAAEKKNQSSQAIADAIRYSGEDSR